MIKRADEILVNIKEKLSKEKKLKLFIIIGFIGIGLIFLSDLFSTPKETKATTTAISTDTSIYKNEIEKELVKILSEISGVGKTKVMLTIEGTMEFEFAEEINKSTDKSSDTYSENYQNKYVFIENGDTKEALVKKILKPKINGVIVVCEGGDSAKVSEKVYKAVSTVLGISTNRICVVKG